MYFTHLLNSKHGTVFDVPGQETRTECPRTNKFPLDPVFPLEVGGLTTTISALENRRAKKNQGIGYL